VTTYLLAGGGTAGHVNPLLAVADRIMEREPTAKVLVLGTKEGLESRLVPDRGYELLTIDRLPFPRRVNGRALGFPAAFARTVRETRDYLTTRTVDVVVGFGGYAAAPAYIAARSEKIPLVVHESNAKPGMANRLGARFTRFVGVAFDGTNLPHARIVGMPLRREIEQLDKVAALPVAIAYLGLDSDKPVLLVTGGSTGARSINRTIAASVDAVLKSGWQVLHITGAASDIVDPNKAGYVMLRYCDRMDLAIAAANFAVSRAGSATVSEFSAVGLPAVYIPYPVGNGEQRFNARGIVEARGAVLVDDADFTPDWVNSTLVPLLRDPQAIEQFAANAKVAGSLDGADRTVDLITLALSSR
jgi:UDP-N-acetylglucosamine--N-acetylmuramyl-(pentapeptide) pyrophosphoryl-undecaprenol N-acetylglucosamine transferase